MTKEGDDRLLELWSAGDRDAGNRLILRHFDSLYRFFRSKLHDADLVDDLIQRTFLACIESRDRFRGDAGFRTYVFAVARNTLLGHFRQLQRPTTQAQPLGSFAVHELVSTASSLLAKREEERLLLEALVRIPLDLQLAIELHYWEGLKMAELAVVLDIPVGTVKSKLRRARGALNDVMARLANDPSALARTRSDFDRWATKLRDRVSRT